MMYLIFCHVFTRDSIRATINNESRLHLYNSVRRVAVVRLILCQTCNISKRIFDQFQVIQVGHPVDRKISGYRGYAVSRGGFFSLFLADQRGFCNVVGLTPQILWFLRWKSSQREYPSMGCVSDVNWEGITKKSSMYLEVVHRSTVGGISGVFLSH